MIVSTVEKKTAELTSRNVGVNATAFGHGVWGTALPFPSPLAYSFGYLVMVDDGVIAVDLGWDSDESWDAFELGLKRAGVGLDDLLGVVVTHVHPDHYGLAERVRTHSEAWIALHPAEVPLIVRDDEERRDRVRDMSAWLVRCGVPAAVLAEIQAEEAEIQSSFASVQPDIMLNDGDVVPGSSGALVAWHTPGHTAGHLCYFDRDRNVVFTGDHVLPRVTPNVSKRPGSDSDPLEDYLGSLDKLTSADGAFILPGHEWAFDSLGRRLHFLKEHHAERSQEVAELVAAGASTVWEVTRMLRFSRPFAQLVSRGRRQALGETHAHLYRLFNRGILAVDPGQPELWSFVGTGR